MYSVDIGERKKRILKAIVENYVETAEPVGSKAICVNLGLSSATIRNEMAELTQMGLLEQPHTSAGRIPSAKGYRIYVNDLMNRQRLSLEETMEINRALNLRIQQLDTLIQRAGTLLSELTSYPAYALTQGKKNNVINRFDFIYVDRFTVIVVLMLDGDDVRNRLMHFPGGLDETFVRKLSTVFNAAFTGITAEDIDETLILSCERACMDNTGVVAAIAGFAISVLDESSPNHAFISGASHILNHPEYRNPDRAQRLLNYLTGSDMLLRLPDPDEVGKEPKIIIGPENVSKELSDSSVVVASYELGSEMRGIIGVVGPTRMDYGRVAAHLSYIARELRRLFIGSDLPPPPPNLEEGKPRKE